MFENNFLQREQELSILDWHEESTLIKYLDDVAVFSNTHEGIIYNIIPHIAVEDLGELICKNSLVVGWGYMSVPNKYGKSVTLEASICLVGSIILEDLDKNQLHVPFHMFSHQFEEYLEFINEYSNNNGLKIQSGVFSGGRFKYKYSGKTFNENEIKLMDQMKLKYIEPKFNISTDYLAYFTPENQLKAYFINSGEIYF